MSCIWFMIGLKDKEQAANQAGKKRKEEMDIKTRVLTARLLEKLDRKPAYAQRLGITVENMGGKKEMNKKQLHLKGGTNHE